ncbi:MAG: nuclear transport factor 2 family protein [Candidatus Andeanibacterium colombiense]|uniref:Nuclear transport factor 2 family protein n=1 Tax=Candidatus Andeanibacterium colombiense TaxID=3121345 RepID=A0AAJ5X8B5_9SPHN|nr:MAG: nuclear transport factor 2 family protein [Sphingomonadaceae bacterium]
MKKTVTLALVAAVMALGAVPSAAHAEPQYGANYASDRAEIEDLMARYLFAIDYFDWDAYVATFAPDGELEFASGTSKGRDAIRTAVTNFSKSIGKFYHTADGNPAKLRHVILQHVIRVEGDHAWGRSQWLEMANHGEGDQPKIGTYGMYEDEFVKLDGHWLIKRRNVLNDFIPKRGTGPENPVRVMDRAADAR